MAQCHGSLAWRAALTSHAVAWIDAADYRCAQHILATPASAPSSIYRGSCLDIKWLDSRNASCNGGKLVFECASYSQVYCSPAEIGSLSGGRSTSKHDCPYHHTGTSEEPHTHQCTDSNFSLDVSWTSHKKTTGRLASSQSIITGIIWLYIPIFYQPPAAKTS